MSNNVVKYGELDTMPTDYLRTLLSLDINGASGVELDPEAIIHIMEVIEERESSDGRLEKVDVAAAWDKFNSEYRPSNTNPDGSSPICEAAKTKRHVHLKRFAVTVAIVIAVFVCGTIAAGASGFDLWGAVVQWATETFGFDNDAEYADVINDRAVLPCSDLKGLLTVNGVNANLTPTWIPSGFVPGSCSRSVTPQMAIYQATYENGDREIAIQIFAYFDGAGSVHTYEKLPEGNSDYVAGGKSHSIAVNSDGSVVALWCDGNFECSISGDVTETEMKQILDSIYKG